MRKKITKILLMGLMISQQIKAQQTFNGGSFNGFEHDQYEAEKANGLVAVYRADRGVCLSGTNVYAWKDLSGNGFDLFQGQSTNWPSFCLFGGTSTTNYPAVTFNTTPGDTSKHLKSQQRFPTLFSGTDRPISMIIAINSQTNTAVPLILGFGNSQATNAFGSLIAVRPNGNTPTIVGWIHNSDTNAGSGQITRTASTSTNAWFVFGAIYSGTSGVCCNNLAIGPATPMDQTATSLNQFSVGVATVAGGAYFPPGRAGIYEMQFYTNNISTTFYTNAVNSINARVPIRMY